MLLVRRVWRAAGVFTVASRRAPGPRLGRVPAVALAARRASFYRVGLYIWSVASSRARAAWQVKIGVPAVMAVRRGGLAAFGVQARALWANGARGSLLQPVSPIYSHAKNRLDASGHPTLANPASRLTKALCLNYAPARLTDATGSIRGPPCAAVPARSPPRAPATEHSCRALLRPNRPRASPRRSARVDEPVRATPPPRAHATPPPRARRAPWAARPS